MSHSRHYASEGQRPASSGARRASVWGVALTLPSRRTEDSETRTASAGMAQLLGESTSSDAELGKVR